MSALTCRDCSAPITRQSKTGRCRACAFAVTTAAPEFEAKRVAGIRALHLDPTFRARKARAIHAAHMAARLDPEKRARLNRNIFVARARLSDPDVRARMLAARPAAGRKRTATVMSWCPSARWGEYRRLVRSKRLLAAEARRVIEDTLSPLERQLVAIQQGARLIARPDLSDKRGYDFTLAGASPLGGAGAP
jgi:hypothetical protein